MMSSLSKNSIQQYNVCLKKWWKFCKENSVDIFAASVPNVIKFLTELYNQGNQYGTLNSCRSALALIAGSSHISQDDRISRFLRGVYRLRPPVPKYNFTWDTNCVLDNLAKQYPNEKLTLIQLTKKTITLLTLTTAHRMQTLSKIDITNIHITTDQIIIKIPDIVKTSRIGCKQPLLYIPFFLHKSHMCPAKTLQCYINRTSSLRQSDTLFIGIKRPHNTVGTQTLSRWVKSTLSECGIDTSIFSAHSTRHASTSRAHSLGVSIDAIRNTAGWSGNSTVFAKFYNRTILTNDHISLAQSVIGDKNQS